MWELEVVGDRTRHRGENFVEMKKISQFVVITVIKKILRKFFHSFPRIYLSMTFTFLPTTISLIIRVQREWTLLVSVCSWSLNIPCRLLLLLLVMMMSQVNDAFALQLWNYVINWFSSFHLILMSWTLNWFLIENGFMVELQINERRMNLRLLRTV